MSFTFKHTDKEGKTRELTILERNEFIVLSDEDKLEYQSGPIIPLEDDAEVEHATLQVQSFIYDLINEENLFNGIPGMLEQFMETNYREKWEEAIGKSKLDREDFFWDFIDTEGGDEALDGIDLHIINEVYKSDFWYSKLIEECKKMDNISIEISPREHVERFNNILCDFWKYTPFAKDPLPRCMVSDNDDGTVNFSYQVFSGESDDGQLSLFYIVNTKGIALCRDTNEELDLKEEMVIGSVIATIISDLKGTFDIHKASKAFYSSLLEDKD